MTHDETLLDFLRGEREPLTAEELCGRILAALRYNAVGWSGLPQSLVETRRMLEALERAGVLAQQAGGKWWFAAKRAKPVQQGLFG